MSKQVDQDQAGKLAEEVIKITMREVFFKSTKTDDYSREDHQNSMSVRAVSKELLIHSGLVWCDGTNALAAVAAEGTPRRLNYLLSLPHYVCRENLSNDTPLLEAITRTFRWRDSFMVKDLIDRGWKVSVEAVWRAAAGRNPSHCWPYASCDFLENAFHDTSILSYLLDHGGNANGDRNFPALKNAIKMFNVEGVGILLEHRADPNFEADDGTRPIDQAAIAYRSPDKKCAAVRGEINRIARLLLEAGAHRTPPEVTDLTHFLPDDFIVFLAEVEAEAMQQ